MTDLSDYELRVLRQMATGGDEGVIYGAALYAAVETLGTRDLITVSIGTDGTPFWDATDAGRALVRSQHHRRTRNDPL